MARVGVSGQTGEISANVLNAIGIHWNGQHSGDARHHVLIFPQVYCSEVGWVRVRARVRCFIVTGGVRAWVMVRVRVRAWSG